MDIEIFFTYSLNKYLYSSPMQKWVWLLSNMKYTEGINYGLKRTEFSKEYNFMSPWRIVALKTTLYLRIFKIYSASEYGEKMDVRNVLSNRKKSFSLNLKFSLC